MNSVQKENLIQAKAVVKLHPEPDEVQVIIAMRFGEGWRDIIESFKKNIGREPNEDDLIWCLGEKLNNDPKLVVKEIEKLYIKK